MDAIFGLSSPQNPQIRYKLQVPKNPIYRWFSQVPTLQTKTSSGDVVIVQLRFMLSLGTMVPQFANRPIGTFLYPCENHLWFTPVLTTRIMTALPLPRRHCRIFIAETQTCLQVLNLLLKIYLESRIPQISLTSERGRRSIIAFFTKSLQMCCPKNWIAISSFKGIIFSAKKPKDQTNFSRPTNLRWGQKSQKAK